GSRSWWHATARRSWSGPTSPTAPRICVACGSCLRADAGESRTLEAQLHAVVRRHESQPLVEAQRIASLPVGGELHHDAAPRPRAFDRPLEHRRADAPRTDA